MTRPKENKLVAVRCLGSKDTLSSCYAGSLMEVKESELKALTKSSRYSAKSSIEARAPVVGMFQNIGRYPNWKSAGTYGSVTLHRKKFIATGEIPVSYYKRVPLSNCGKSLERIVNRRSTEGYYISTHKKEDLTSSVLTKFIDDMPFKYLWKKERPPNEKGKPYTFMEARVYPLDVIVSPCPKEVKGFILCIYSRGIKNYYVERMLEDVYILSSDTDYVDFLDGVALNRQAANPQFLKEYLSDLSIKESLLKLKQGGFNPQEKEEK